MKKIFVLVNGFFILTLCGCSSKDINIQTISELEFDRNEQQLQNDKITLNMEVSDSYEQNQTTSSTEVLQSETEQNNSYADFSITFDFEDRSKTVDSNMIDDWVMRLHDGSVSKDADGKPMFDR